MKTWAALVLAAGRSLRFGELDKLQIDLDGKPLLSHCLDILETAGLSQTILVVNANCEIPERSHVTQVVNACPELGMGASLAAGMTSLGPCDGVFVVLADMPFLDASMLKKMKEKLFGNDIVVPLKDGRYGHPVLFGPNCFASLKLCHGDVGARHLITSGRFCVVTCEDIHQKSQHDIDTTQDLAEARRFISLGY